MDYFDLAIALRLDLMRIYFTIEKVFPQTGLTTFIITKKVSEITEKVKTTAVNFLCYLDRASDVDDNFLELAKIITNAQNPHFNILTKKLSTPSIKRRCILSF